MRTKEEILEILRENIIDCDISYRGGNLKVDASELFESLSDRAIVGAYQNYLGGGIAGRIVGASMFMPDDLESESERELFPVVLEACQMLFHELNNGGGDDYMQENHSDYDFNQGLPVSGY